MKIAQISKVWSRGGGVGTYLLDVSSALALQGHEIMVIHSDPKPALPAFLKDHYYLPCFAEFEDKKNNGDATRLVLEILKSQKPDIVHIHANDNFNLESEIRRRFPAIKTFHVYEFCPTGNKFHHALGKVCRHATGPLCLARMGYKRCTKSKRPWLLWQQYRRAAAANQSNHDYSKIIAASDYVRQQALATGYPPHQIEVLSYFTPLADLPLLEKERGGEKTILFTGRIVAEKGWRLLLKALSLLPEELNWRLIVDGDGQELEKMIEMTRRMNLSGRVEFPGWLNRERHEESFRNSAVVVVPSIWPEPFGLVGIEAMSYAKPVVAFAVGGIPEWLENGATGFLIPPYDRHEMAEKIAYLLEHPVEAAAMGRKGRKRAEEEFTAEKHIARLLEIYRGVMHG